jgi:GNAT superfamily N-acetyltransferase
MEDLSSALAEGVEAEFMYQLESMAAPSVKVELGIATTRIGGGVALSIRHDVTGFWNKALGFGFEEPVTHDLIGRVLDFYRSQGSTGTTFQIAHSVLPPDWDEIRAAFGLRPASHYVKLACRVEDFWPAESKLVVEPVRPEDVREWAAVTFRGFGMPEEGFTEMLAATYDHPGFHPVAAWDGDTMVATANLFVRGEVASLNSGATLREHRNRGAQSALLTMRAELAADLGCRWLVAETGMPSERRVNPSLNNMLRSGLRPLYSRRNWVWEPDAG